MSPNSGPTVAATSGTNSLAACASANSSPSGTGSGARHASSRSSPTAAAADRSSWVNASDQVVATVWLDPAGSPRANRSGRRCRNNTRYLARLLALARM